MQCASDAAPAATPRAAAPRAAAPGAACHATPPRRAPRRRGEGGGALSTATALLRRVCDVKDGEVPALLWSFGYFFCVLCGYYVLRPVREEMGISGGMDRLPWLFTAVFASMLAAVPAFSALVSRVPRRRFIPIVYR